VGHHVEKIRRVQYGPLTLDVPPGDWRNLTLLEVAKLKTAASGPKLKLPPDVPAAMYSRTSPKPARASKPASSKRSRTSRSRALQSTRH